MDKSRIEKEKRAFVHIYREEVLPHRNRKVKLLGRKCSPTIISTFLGFEVKAGRKRITCPDKTTARYLKIFTELGLEEVLIPYDPTRTAGILPSLESHFLRIKELLADEKLAESERRKATRQTYQQLRKQLKGGAQ
ncbi:MAG TPA: hypothetical protein VKZ59_07350 [Acidobacteriota bacterium]|nr:hypothetical protein [Acidobacteriota bacterium]